MKRYLIFSITFLLLLQMRSFAQNVSINNDGSEPDPSAALDVKASDKGVLIPRVDFNNLPVSPATGLLVYVTANGPDGNDAFYYYNGTQWQKLEGAAGLENFTESNYTYDSKTGVKFLATNAATNVDLVLSPKGNGAIIAHQPDGTATGGNIRGSGALDLQIDRDFATQVASGFVSIVLGGKNNTASGDFSTAMGFESKAPSAYETVIGLLNTNYSPTSTSSWVAVDRLFVIGNGDPIWGTRSNALTILKNANTTIGGSLTVNGNGSATSYTLPTARGTSGQILSTNGSGGTSWTTPTSGTVTSVTGTAPIVSTGGNTPVISIAAATTSAAGSMSAADKTKLDGLVSSQWATSGSSIYYNTGNVGIGTTTPESKLTLSNNPGDGFDEWTDYQLLLHTNVTPQRSYGIGIKDYTLAFNSDRDFDFDQDGSTVMTIKSGKVGIGSLSPLALLDLGNSISNRKILLYSSADNDHQFTGFGLNADALRFQLATTSGNFKFYGATSATTSDELFRIEGDGDLVAQGQIKNVSNPTDAQDAATKNYVDNRSKTYMVGDFAQGGIVFWVDETGQHGLVAATADQSSGIQWYNGTYRYTGTSGDGLYAGAMNTAMIIATQMADNQTGNFAAKVCADYSVTISGVTYGDWYLPSKYELNLLFQQKTAVGGFTGVYYWSSTESSNGLAWGHDFDSGAPGTNQKNVTDKVRAIRAF